jgi:phage host-nuclease inhibitor protein Gam
MSIAEQDLYSYLLESEEQESQSEGFVVDSLEKAEWCLRKLAKLAQEDAEDEAMAQREIQRIQAWLEARKKPRQQSREFFEEHLRRFHEKLLQDDPKRNKTVKLPHGTLKARKLPDKWEYDEQAILEWAKANARIEFIRVKAEPDKQAIKQYVKETGEVPPGVTVTTQGIKFDVEVEL